MKLDNCRTHVMRGGAPSPARNDIRVDQVSLATSWNFASKEEQTKAEQETALEALCEVICQFLQIFLASFPHPAGEGVHRYLSFQASLETTARWLVRVGVRDTRGLAHSSVFIRPLPSMERQW